VKLVEKNNILIQRLDQNVRPSNTYDRGSDFESVKTDDGNVAQQKGAELKAQFEPTLGEIKKILGGVINTDMLLKTTSPPEDRAKYIDSFEVDQMFQISADLLVQERIIGEGTFVISNTGHDIPIMAALFKKLDMGGGLNLSSYDPNVSGNGSRVGEQAQTWGDEIQKYQQINSSDGKVSSLFLGIDAHRTDAAKDVFDETKLPTAKQLRDAGINKIVLLNEGAANGTIDNLLQDIRNYLKKMKNEGIEVIVKGIDNRVPDPYLIDANSPPLREATPDVR
jgi:hypothetical protein